MISVNFNESNLLPKVLFGTIELWIFTNKVKCLTNSIKKQNGQFNGIYNKVFFFVK